MNPEMNPMDPVLERAVSEVRDEAVDSAVIEAAAARVWARLADAAGPRASEHIRNCEDFRALIPDYRAGRLSDARALLLKDHLNACVACRRAYDGKVVAFPTAAPVVTARPNHAYRWAAAAVVVMAAGTASWFAYSRLGNGGGRAYLQAVNGAAYVISGDGVQPIAAGGNLPDGVRVRTAKDSYATLQLRDGSVVEMRERSELYTSASGKDLTIHLGRGNVIVQAAKRSSGHLYVATADCRVAVTGTVFSVNAGVKGSRVSVIEGQVRVAQDNREKVLQPGDQAVSGPNLEAAPISYDISWSPNRDRVSAAKASSGAGKISPLLDRIPASAMFVALVPDASASLKELPDSLRDQAERNPQLKAVMSRQGAGLEQMLTKLGAAGDYLDDIAIVGMKEPQALVMLATTRREGFAALMKKEGLAVAVEERPGLAVFSPDRAGLESTLRSLDAGQSGFQSSPCYARLADAQREGAANVICADVASASPSGGHGIEGASYFMAEERRAGGRQEARATLGFNGPRTGIAAWLAPPAPMGSLDYVSPEANALFAFVVKSPAAIVDELVSLQQRSSQAGAAKALDEVRRRTGVDIRNDLAASLGGEFALALDGPIIPTPSWKLIAEVYDPARFQSTIQKVVAIYNQERAKAGQKPLRMGQETVNGRVFHMIGASEPNPLTEAHYTFSDGYLLAAPSNALLTQALQSKAGRTSIARSSTFVSLMPRDRYANFSAVMYTNFGTSLAPVVGLLGAFMPPKGQGPNNEAMQKLGNLKPTFVAAYGEPDRITVAGSGPSFGSSLSNLSSGGLLGIAGPALPFGQMMGTRRPQPAYR